MNLGDYLIWEATNGPLLIRVVIGLVMLARRLRGQPAFTERDWLFLFGHSRKEVFSPRLLLRLSALLLASAVAASSSSSTSCLTASAGLPARRFSPSPVFCSPCRDGCGKTPQSSGLKYPFGCLALASGQPDTSHCVILRHFSAN